MSIIRVNTTELSLAAHLSLLIGKHGLAEVLATLTDALLIHASTQPDQKEYEFAIDAAEALAGALDRNKVT